MGKKARQERAKHKAFIRRNGLYENEFGELKKRVTKAEARRQMIGRFLLSRSYLSMMEADITEAAVKHAAEEIRLMEDFLIFGELNAIAMEMG